MTRLNLIKNNRLLFIVVFLIFFPRLVFSQSQSKSLIQGDKSCLSLDFKDISVADAFRVYFDAVKENFVLDKNLSGNVELRLTCVDSSAVLAALIAVSNTVDVKKIDTISYVTPKRGSDTSSSLLQQPSQLLASPAQAKQPEKDAALERKLAQQQHDEEEALKIVRMVKIYNANVGDVVALLMQTQSQDDVIIKPFESDNSIYLKGRAEQLDLVEKSIGLIDKPKRQFMINAKLIATSDNFLENLGTSFNAQLNQGEFTTGAASTFTSAVTAISGGSSLIFQKAGNLVLNAKISAAISNGDAFLVSEPRTIAYENRQSSINQGLRIPYQTQLPMGGFQVSFVDAALTLRVTPRLGDNKNRIILDIYFSKNSAGSPSPAGVSIETREITTTVALKSGETLALGGIDEFNENSSNSGVPVLRDIPILGYAFGAQTQDSKHNKIVLFITPTLI